MKKLILLSLIIITLSLFLQTKTARAQYFCLTFNTNQFAYVFEHLEGQFLFSGESPYGVAGLHAGENTLSRTAVTRYTYLANSLAYIDFRIYPKSPSSYPIKIELSVYGTNQTVYTSEATLNSFPQGQWSPFLTFGVGGVQSYAFTLRVTQTSNSDPLQKFVLFVDKVCFAEPFPTPIPNPTLVPPTVTRTPSNTPQHTLVPTNSPPPTTTRTPTITRTPSATAATHTPSPTAGAGTPTDTPAPPSVTGTLAPLLSGSFPTPTPNRPNLHFPFPVPIFPTPAVVVPSPISDYIPATAPVATSYAGNPVGMIQVPLEDSLTKVAAYQAGVLGWATQVFLDAEGTPMADLRNQAHQIGSGIGGFFVVLRGLRDSVGQTGDLVVILLLVLAFNIMIRIVTFVLTFVFFAWRLIRMMITFIAQTPAIFIFLVIVVIIIGILIISGARSDSLPVAGGGTITTLTPTSTGSVTATATLLPIEATATSRFQGFRQTPTPIPLNMTPVFGITLPPDVSGQTADRIINTYRAANTATNGMVDVLAFIMVAGVTIGLGIRLVGRLNRDK